MSETDTAYLGNYHLFAFATRLIIFVYFMFVLVLFLEYCTPVLATIYYIYILYIIYIDAGLLTRSQYSEGPATGHLDTGFSWFPCV